MSAGQEKGIVMRQILLSFVLAMAVAPVLAVPPQSKTKSSPSEKTKRVDGGKAPAKGQAVSQKALSDDETIVHVLNRFAFGPRPGDIDRLRRMGWQQWLENQLAPNQIADNSVEAKLSGFSLARLGAGELGFREAALRKGIAVANRRAARLQSRSDSMMDSAMQETRPANGSRRVSDVTEAERRDLEASQTARRELTEASRQMVTEKFVRAVESERQLQEVLVDFWSNHFNIDISKTRAIKISDEYQTIRPHAAGKFFDLLKASARSPAMLVYLDNNQSVAEAPKLPVPGIAFAQFPANYDALRRLARRGLPGPSQLLERVDSMAKESGTAPDIVYERLVRASGNRNRDQRGLNENYARELLELHTLGVDGGYSQKDVQEVARCLTGWTVAGGRYGGEFVFNPRTHDNGAKVVLGHAVPAGGGIRDGEMVLEMLARHPATMRHISRKLCIRFVSDNPPSALVDRCVDTWRKTDGDITAIVRTIAFSPEFRSRACFRAKVKSPFEYAVSSVRALGGAILENAGTGVALRPTNSAGSALSMEGQVSLMGQPLFRFAFPTGWPEDSSKWVSSGALISRINFALALTSGQLRDVVLAGKATELGEGKTNSEWIDALSQGILGNTIGTATRQTVVQQLDLKPSAPADPATTAPRLTALLLGSPEFQRR